MPLVSLELHNVRAYEHVQLVPDPHLNLISGANASGKTTLLEAIHLLATGRSFRTTQTEQLQRHATASMSVMGQLQTEGAGLIRLGLAHTTQGRQVSINGLEQRKVSGLAQHLPLQTISPDTHYDFGTAPNTGAVFWIGVCSTWNKISRYCGLVTSAFFINAMRH
jgi:DNA replication and repair protein RecF